ncbi:BON domain-containing protein [Janthinobacterium sp. J1-1]|uniref:BON domain-containing protein n=1 Tax=Janthinobacterium sp. J1-1 TaxID=3065910 RepID=UPI0028123271|nr:BON domain-containing protein [Janthinobacterium sp. J1-1]
MNADQEITARVEQELKWDVRIDASHIAVSVKQQTVTLSGYVRAYGHKLAAERDAQRVAGVQGVANDLEVHPPSRPDSEILRDAIAAIALQLPVSSASIKVTVDQGHVLLAGTVEWNYQREHAVRALRHVQGIRSIDSDIRIAHKALPADVKAQIQAALRRSALIEASGIKVEADGDTVTLSGKVRSWKERDEVERAAWMAPGIAAVRNQLEVSS